MSPDLKLSAEKIWKSRVLDFIEPLYKDRWLPSHDLGHHLRVWENACLIQADLISISNTFYEELFLACLFHDVGMLYDTTEEHGHRSRVLCREFLELHPGQLHFDPSQLLEAIEHHDDKSYRVRLDGNMVYQLLSIADDMDAFGALGLYRYLEIYLIRDREVEKIPGLILENAEARYQKMCSLSDKLELPMEQISKRYQKLQHFLVPNTYPEPPETLVEWVFVNIVEKEADPNAVFAQKTAFGKNSRIRDFAAETHNHASLH